MYFFPCIAGLWECIPVLFKALIYFVLLFSFMLPFLKCLMKGGVPFMFTAMTILYSGSAKAGLFCDRAIVWFVIWSAVKLIAPPGYDSFLFKIIPIRLRRTTMEPFLSVAGCFSWEYLVTLTSVEFPVLAFPSQV